MRTLRFPIAGLMVAVLVVAVGLAALRDASENWAGITFLLTCGILGLAVVGTICRGNGECAWWLGFSLFGWGYLVLAFWSTLELPTMALFDTVGSRLGMTVSVSGGKGGSCFCGYVRGPGAEALRQIIRCHWALVAALFGGIVARAIFGGPMEPVRHGGSLTLGVGEQHPGRWLLSVVVALAACGIMVLHGLFGSQSVPGLWAGATFLSTCGLLGMTVLGVAGSQGKARQIWLGAALFGVGYMTMAFGRSLDRETRPSLPTDHLLGASALRVSRGRQRLSHLVVGYRFLERENHAGARETYPDAVPGGHSARRNPEIRPGGHGQPGWRAHSHLHRPDWLARG